MPPPKSRGRRLPPARELGTIRRSEPGPRTATHARTHAQPLRRVRPSLDRGTRGGEYRWSDRPPPWPAVERSRLRGALPDRARGRPRLAPDAPLPRRAGAAPGARGGPRVLDGGARDPGGIECPRPARRALALGGDGAARADRAPALARRRPEAVGRLVTVRGSSRARDGAVLLERAERPRGQRHARRVVLHRHRTVLVGAPPGRRGRARSPLPVRPAPERVPLHRVVPARILLPACPGRRHPGGELAAPGVDAVLLGLGDSVLRCRRRVPRVDGDGGGDLVHRLRVDRQPRLGQQLRQWPGPRLHPGPRRRPRACSRRLALRARARGTARRRLLHLSRAGACGHRRSRPHRAPGVVEAPGGMARGVSAGRRRLSLRVRPAVAGRAHARSRPAPPAPPRLEQRPAGPGTVRRSPRPALPAGRLLGTRGRAPAPEAPRPGATGLAAPSRC